MPIAEENIKLMAPQRLTDTDDGGGRMTGTEIVDGNVNNMFGDISRLDRVYGRVSLREGFVAVVTDDNEVYNGAHVILTNPAKDPLVNVCLFSIDNPAGVRTEARDRIEAYVVRGPIYFGWLWSNQLEGTRSISLFQPVGSDTPAVGDVLYLIENEGTAEEYSQYVRITGVSAENIDFTLLNSTTTRQVVTLDIGDPLRHTFHGIEITYNDDPDPDAKIHTTVVADAAKYYGAMRLTQEVVIGDINVNVDSIFTHLVPSAQSEAPLTDLKPGEAGPVVESGESKTVTAPAFVCEDGAVFYFGRGMMPGTVQLSGGGRSYTDDGAGQLMEGLTVSGQVNYGEGTITFVGSTSWSGLASVTATIAALVSRINNTLLQEVEINNRGYNYTRILNPPPTPGTLIVDFMSQGKWYRLRDKGAGELVPDITGTGTGTVSYLTGSVVLTCGALPDAGTAILYGWGNPLEIQSKAGSVSIDTAQIDHTLAEFPVKPGSVTISWPSGEGTATLVDNGSGVLSGGGSGSVNYATGRCLFTPTALPVAGSNFTFDYDKYPKGSENITPVVSAGVATVQLAQAPIEPGSAKCMLEVSVSGYAHVYNLTDNGDGTLSAVGWSIAKPVSWEFKDWDGRTEVSGITGTVDYTLGKILIDVSPITGTESYSEPIITVVHHDAVIPTNQV